ncbi:MAG: serine hydrolase domain-containing protein [Burkholderiaceae bacterium]
MALLTLCAVPAALAQAPQLPAPEAVSLDKLSYMSTFPPAGEQLVDQGNRTKYPQMRWALQHTREFVPTRNIRRGPGAPSPLPRAEKNLDEVAFEDDKGQKTTIADWLKASYADAIIVMHRGRVVYERYMNQMRPETPHLLFSVTKSFTGLLAAQLAHEGKLDLDAPVTKYVPELADSAWGDMTVRHVMDMTGAVRYREILSDPTSDIFPYLFSSTMLPAPPSYTGPRTIYDFVKTLKKEGEHGAGFVYRTVHSEVLGWIVSRVTGQHFTEVMSERLWSKLGMDEDAYVMIDPVGTPLQGSGLSATARDLARFGEMVRRGGEFNGQRVIAKAVIDDLMKGGDREKFKASPNRAAWAGYSYHNQWWFSHNADGAFEALGVHGQYVHINPAAEMVVVKASSHPVNFAGFWHPATLKAWAALAQAVRQ